MTEAAPPQLTLDWLHIKKFRNVEDTRLEFGKGHNVILGINGTGKTQLLELLGALCSGNLRRLVRDERADVELEFAVSVGGRSGTAFISVSRTHTRQDGRTRVDVHVQAGSSPTERPGEAVRNLSEKDPWPALASFAFPFQHAYFRPRLPNWVDELDVPVRSFARFDEALGFFELLTSRSDAAPPALTLEIPRDGGGRMWTPSHDGGAAVLVQNIPLPIDDFPVEDGPVSSFGELAGYTAAVAWMRVRSSETSSAATLYEFRNPEFRLARGGSIVSHDDLSFGEKRLLAFLYYAAVADGSNRGVRTLRLPVVADELTNGLHRAWVDACFDRMEGRQTFLATQSPLLLDRIWVDSPDDAKTTFVVCKRVGTADDVRLSWSQLDDEKAQAVFASAERGILHMSQILHFEGIW